MTETICFFISVCALVFSLYQLFLANNAKVLGVCFLRVSLAILAVAAAHFANTLVLTTAVLLFILLSILVLALTRNEVQIHHD